MRNATQKKYYLSFATLYMEAKSGDSIQIGKLFFIYRDGNLCPAA
jgi:hypothetical protein